MTESSVPMMHVRQPTNFPIVALPEGAVPVAIVTGFVWKDEDDHYRLMTVAPNGYVYVSPLPAISEAAAVDAVVALRG